MVTETDATSLAQGRRLAGEDQSPPELLGAKRTVGSHLDFAGVERGNALAADAGHAREGGAEACLVGSGENRFSACYLQPMNPLAQFDANGDCLLGSREVGFQVHYDEFPRSFFRGPGDPLDRRWNALVRQPETLGKGAAYSTWVDSAGVFTLKKMTVDPPPCGAVDCPEAGGPAIYCTRGMGD